MVNRIGLANGGNHANRLGNVHNEGHGDGHSLLGNGIQIGEAAVVDLLLAANLVQLHDLHGLGIVEVSHIGIVKCQMAVLADAQEDQVDGVLLQQFGVLLALFLCVILVAQQVVQFHERNFVEDGTVKERAEARRLALVDAYILVLMETTDLGPVDVGFQQVLQQVVLRGGCGKDNVCDTVLFDDGIDALGSISCGGDTHLGAVFKNMYRQIYYFLSFHNR